MTIIEKIRAEIERLYDEANNYDDSRHYLGEVLSFLDTIEESEKSVPNDLEEAANEYVKDIPTFKDSCLMKAAFEDGWLSCKEQMMKEAVEAKIYGYDDGSFELIASWLDMPNNSIYKDGDKVRIIIVKEDEK